MSARALAFVALALAFGLGARSAAADPTLPRDWVRGGTTFEPFVYSGPRGGWGSHQMNHEFTFRTRDITPGDRLDLDKLPVVAIDALPVVASPATLPQGATHEVVVLRRDGASRLSIQGTEMGVVRLGKANPAGVGRQSAGGVANVCGPHAREHGIVPLSFDALRRVDEQGSLELTWGRGYLDTDACTVALVEHHATRPMHIAGGIVFAFRTRCAACAPGERDALHVVMPEPARDQADMPLPFVHRALTLAPGKSAEIDAQSMFKSPLGHQGFGANDPHRSAWSMPDWEQIVDRQCKQQTTWCSKRVHIEVSQGLDEPEPTVFLGGSL